ILGNTHALLMPCNQRGQGIHIARLGPLQFLFQLGRIRLRMTFHGLLDGIGLACHVFQRGFGAIEFQEAGSVILQLGQALVAGVLFEQGVAGLDPAVENGRVHFAERLFCLMEFGQGEFKILAGQSLFRLFENEVGGMTVDGLGGGGRREDQSQKCGGQCFHVQLLTIGSATSLLTEWSARSATKWEGSARFSLAGCAVPARVIAVWWTLRPGRWRPHGRWREPDTAGMRCSSWNPDYPRLQTAWGPGAAGAESG